MRKILLFCICAFVLCACGNNKAKQLEQRKQAIADSIAQVERQRKEMLERARFDSLSSVAWGDLRFGMSREKALKTVSLKDGNVYDNSIAMGYETVNAIKSAFGLKEFYDVWVFFEENELESMKIESYKVRASHIDDLLDDCAVLAKNFAKKMDVSVPINANYNEINIYNFNEGEEFTYAFLHVGTKSVSIKLGETYSGSEYYYEVYISNSEYPKKKHEPTPEEKARMKKEDEERQRIINNSF